jgi:hypothetical protein
MNNEKFTPTSFVEFPTGVAVTTMGVPISASFTGAIRWLTARVWAVVKGPGVSPSWTIAPVESW